MRLWKFFWHLVRNGFKNGTSYSWSAERSEFIISSRARRAQCVNRVWVLASCKLAALIFTCIYAMVSTMTSYSSLTSKRKRFWIISLNISANIVVTKHALLTDEFIPYRPRLLGFHSSHVNAMKCIYVGVSLSKLQSFFWKISLNSRLIRLEGFNNKISTNSPVCSTWPSGKA